MQKGKKEMNKFKQILAVVFVFALGLGIGQSLSNISWATDWPIGGAGGGAPTDAEYLVSALHADLSAEIDHDVTSQIHGLGASVFAMGNLISAGDSIQYGSLDPAAGGSSDQVVYRLNIAVTFPTAYGAVPDGVGSAASTDASSGLMGSASDDLTTTGMTFKILSNVSSQNLDNVRYLVVGQ